MENDKLSKNIFSLKYPERFSCNVEYYVEGHSVLLVRARDNFSDETLYIIFPWVIYISGALRWNGANFSREDEKCLEVIRRFQLIDELSINNLGHLYHMYMVDTGSFTVISWEATLKTEKPFIEK
ncbi:MAG: hypothetical protein F9K28_11045 [Bacteroidetes bacterium]|nr:MAG: hypothetical protein F9K28_11045 [Bacteroidota bacterium]